MTGAELELRFSQPVTSKASVAHAINDRNVRFMLVGKIPNLKKVTYASLRGLSKRARKRWWQRITLKKAV